MKWLVGFAVSISVLAAQAERPGQLAVTAVRHWSQSDITRIAVEVSGEFHFRMERVRNPERVYFDIANAKPRLDGKTIYSEAIDDKLARRVRVAETTQGVTRVVVDLASVPVDVTTGQLTNPDRLIIELRASPPVTTAQQPSTAPPPSATPATAAEATHTEPSPAVKRVVQNVLEPPNAAATQPVNAEPNKEQLGSENQPPPDTSRTEPDNAPRQPLPPITPAETGKAARHTASGDTSLIRALGLKINRVVIDPGHGGHDQGTQGAKGLAEKELVLDVAKRVGKLIEQQMGAEVIFTRSDDTFIPLEGRTAFANEKRADLFLSIHANASAYTKITGIETYYLNFPDSKDALDVAARENASSQKSVYELRDIIQKITLHDKAEESREFASKVQSSLYNFEARNFPSSRNRGVKRAPFVVLIGATMPSVLAEIGFLSNPREEQMLKRPEYRQKLAEALFHGVAHYAESLSHFQNASTQPAQN